MPESGYNRRMQITRKEFLIGAGSVVVILTSVLLLYSFEIPGASDGAEDAAADTVPAMTAVMQQVLEKSNGFQLLVSYTDEGFQPPHATINEGDTVRFTNNSSKRLWVAAAPVHSGAIYPDGPSSCGLTAFDSCVALAPKEFWEFTFDEMGVWGYVNATDVAHAAALEVR